jgi:two-component system cell cycle response regulator DivK
MPRLLLVDDNEVVEFIVRHILGKEGFEIESITQGYDVFDQIEAFDPDIILLDNWLPDVMGTALCKTIKLKYDIPVILFSAFDWGESFSSYGADDYINKQFEIDEFVAKVKSHVRVKNVA